MSALTYEQDPSYNYLDSSSKKKKGRHRKLDTLTYETIREYFVYTQSQAAKKLGVSVSTLKRKFYSLGYENRWPYIRTVTPKKKGMNNKRSHDSEEEVSAEEEEYEDSEEEMVREPMTRSARKTSSPVSEQNKKKRKVVEQEETSNNASSPQSSSSSRIGFASTSSAFVPISHPKPVEQPIAKEESDEEEDEEYYIASEEEEEQETIEENNEEEEQEPVIVVGANKETTTDHFNNSNISFSDMSTYAHANQSNGSVLNTSFTTTSQSHRLYNEQSQASNQSQDFGDEVVAASMLFQFAADKKKFSSPRLLPPISSLHSTHFMDYHAQPLKKRIPSLGDYRNFNSRTSSSYQSSNNNTSCTPIASEGLILPPIKNLIRGDEVQSIGFNNHQYMVKQHIS